MNEKELRIEGVFYFTMLENETEEQEKERFLGKSYEAGIIINDDCCSYEING